MVSKQNKDKMNDSVADGYYEMNIRVGSAD